LGLGTGDEALYFTIVFFSFFLFLKVKKGTISQVLIMTKLMARKKRKDTFHVITKIGFKMYRK
jgi:hypothetical protein